MSELDKWFPRDPEPEEPEKPKEQGVIEGVKRNRPKQYGRRWYQRRRAQLRRALIEREEER